MLVERNGDAIATPLHGPNSIALKQPIRDYVDKCSTIFTDEFASYAGGIGQEFIGGHETVNHSDKEYVRYENNYDVHNNTAESFNALVKRGHYGIFHHLSKTHLDSYPVTCALFARMLYSRCTPMPHWLRLCRVKPLPGRIRLPLV